MPMPHKLLRPSPACLCILALLLPLPARPQTSASTTHRRSTTHRSASTSSAADTAADNPPGVPKVVGTPKILFALRYVDITVGSGPLAEPRKFYTVQYTGWTTDGKKFDSSYDHGAPYTFPYGAHRVISGWDLGFEGMHVGGKRRLYVPYQLAYGEAGHPPVIPAKANLIFDVELVSMGDSPEPSAPASAPTSTPPPAGAANPSTNPTAPPPTQSTTPNPQPATNPNPTAH